MGYGRCGVQAEAHDRMRIDIRDHLFRPASAARSVCPRAVELAREKTKPMCNLAKDLGISESCLRNSVALADIEEGRRDVLDL